MKAIVRNKYGPSDVLQIKEVENLLQLKISIKTSFIQC